MEQTTADPRRVVIEDVQAIERLEFELGDEGGVLRFCGPNGSGKSTAIRVLQALTGAKVALAPRDGKLDGQATGLGMHLVVSRKVATKGELALGALDHGIDPSVLVNPGFVSEESNDQARIETLAALAKVEADVRLFSRLHDRLPEFLKPATTQARKLTEMAPLVKRDLEHAARIAEDEAAKHAGAAAGLAKNADARGVSPDEPSDAAELAAAWEAAVQERSRVKAEIDAARAKHEAWEKARAQVEKEGPAAAQAIETARARVAALDRELDEAARLVELAHARTGETSAAWRAAREAFEAAKARMDEADRVAKVAVAEDDAALRRREDGVAARAAAKDALDQALAADSAMAAVREAVAAGPGAPPPDAAVLAKAEDAVAAAKLANDRGVLAREAAVDRREAEAHVRRAQAAEELAGRLRAAAGAVWDVVADAVGAVRPRGLSIRNGRVVVEIPGRGEKYFVELSDGQRWRVALDAALDSVGEGGIVPIRQEAWEGLDPENRAEIVRRARERRTWVVTAEATDGELRAEVVPA